MRAGGGFLLDRIPGARHQLRARHASAQPHPHAGRGAGVRRTTRTISAPSPHGSISSGSPRSFTTSEQPIQRRPVQGPAGIGPTLLAPMIQIRKSLAGAP
jgi:hypothetical protein